MNQLKTYLEALDPERAMKEISDLVKGLLPHVSQRARTDFIYALTGDADSETLPGLVHLWLATCMDEGVDPKQMCQSLVNKVAQSEVLKAVTDPDILVLFEDWLEELEKEVVARVKEDGCDRAEDLARTAGISQAGAAFLLAKLKREGKL